MTGKPGGGRRTGTPRRVDRLLVVVLGSALPARFRTRQQAEWAADLGDLAREGNVTARWRYLLAAACTVPALRSLARQADGDRHSVATSATPTTRTLAWALMINSGWALLSWLVVIAGPYLTLDVAARQTAGIDSDPKGMWPIGDSSLPSPLRVALELGGRAATGMDLLLVPVIVVVTVGFVLLPRRRAGHDRLSTLARGAVIAAVASGLTAVDLLVSLTTTVTGVALSVTAVAGAALVVGAFGLPRRWRIALGLLAAAALAVAVTDNTVGSAMVVWFRD